MIHTLIPAIIAFIGLTALAAPSLPQVLLDPQGIDIAQSQAIVKTLQAAAAVYVRDFGFDMPQTIHCTVTVNRKFQSRLWTDGNDRITQQLPSKDKLAPPAQSGIFHIYGLCHEPGHIAMYRLLKDHDYFSSAALEGWAHYTGSVVVDSLFAQFGQNLWWQPYDYRPDGTQRLDRQLAAPNPPPIAQAAGEWRKLEKIIGKKGFPRLFRAWQAANINPYHPDALLPTLQHTFPDKADALAAWWTSAAPILLEPVKLSDFPKTELLPAQLSGHPTLLKLDDNTPDGKWAYNDAGHGRAFSAPAEGPWYLRCISVYASRYGSNPAPDREFEFVLCDEQYRPIAHWKGSYAKLPRGQPQWLKLETTPTQVPDHFTILALFRTSATEGIYTYFDTSTTGQSSIALPGKTPQPFKEGDWMIRVELDKPRN